MKLIALIFILFHGNYCDGYKDGFKEGYCLNVVGCIPPPTPPCPTPRVEEKNTYNGGKLRGMVDGKKKRESK